MPKIDPITFAVVRNNLMSVANGMQEVAFRCAVTPMMYEIRDSCFAILDANAGVIAQSQGMVLFLGSLGPATKNCLDMVGSQNLEPGDVVISSVPIITGSHAADGILFTPIFYHNQLFGYAVSKTHWQDLGAKSFYPSDTKSIYEEGLHIPPIRFYKRGELQKEFWETIKWNSRAPELVWGDMQAQIAGCRFAEKRVAELLDKYGFENVTACIQEMYDYGERMTRLAIQGIKDGTWTAEDYLDSNGIDLDKPILHKVTVTIKDSDIIIDFTGSAPEQRGPMNTLLVTTIAAARIAVKALTTPDLPANEGCFRPIKVIAPEKTICNASATAPTWLFSWIAHHSLELINKALYESLPEKIPACSGADVCIQGFSGTDQKTGLYWGTIIPIVIGQGGDLHSDGENYLFHIGGGSPKSTPTEIIETLYPIFVDKVEFVTDSGGAGKHRGGMASRIHYHPLTTLTFFTNIEKAKTPLWGVDGGQEGLRNNLVVDFQNNGERQILKTSGIELGKDDTVIGTAGGGCGYGQPFEREPEAVLKDVINGYVSIEHARLDYGVVIDRNLQIDTATTKMLRADARK
jgi:N-methylhydantoinase B